MIKKLLERSIQFLKFVLCAMLLFKSADGQLKSIDSVAIEFVPKASMISKSITYILPELNSKNSLFYVGTDGEGVFQFIQNKWYCLTLGLDSENSKRISSMAYLKGNSNKVLLLGTKCGLFRSTDGGAHWHVTQLLNEINCISSIIGDSSSAIAGTKDGLYQIQEANNSCKIDFLGLKGKIVSSVAGTKTKRGELFIYAIVDSEIFGRLSSDGDWQKLYIKQTNKKARTIALDVINPNKVYIGTEQGVIRTALGDTNLNILAKSNDNFSYWRVDKLISHPYIKNNIYGIFFNSATQIYQIGHSDDAAENWQEIRTAANLEMEKFTAISILDKYSTLIMGTGRGKLIFNRRFIEIDKEKRCYSILWKGKRRYATISLATFLLTWATFDMINCNRKLDHFVPPKKLPDPQPAEKKNYWN